MSQFNIPNSGLIKPPPSDELPQPVEDDSEQPIRAARTDSLIHVNRASTPAAVTGMRRTPRLSIADINSMDLPTLKDHLSRISVGDDRTPIEQAMDLIDLPRNTIANIAVGQPSAGGVAGLIGGPAAIGASIGALGGLPGALAGGAIGAGIGAVGALGGLAVRALGSGDFRKEVQKTAEPSGTAAADQPRIMTSDVLRTLGVKNRIVNGLAGFVGDVAFDPLTYVGASGFGTVLKGAEAGKTLALTGTKAAELNAAIKAASEGRVAESVWGKVLAEHPDLAGKSVNEITRELKGITPSGVRGGVNQVFRVLGGEKEYKGGRLARDFFSEQVTPAAIATRAAMAESVKGSGTALRIGLKANEVGSEILHMPFGGKFFPELSVQVPAFTAAAKQANRVADIAARAREAGYVSNVLRSQPVAATVQAVATAGNLADELRSLNLEHINTLDALDSLKNTPPGTPVLDLEAPIIAHAKSIEARKAQILQQMQDTLQASTDALPSAATAVKLENPQDVLAQVHMYKLALGEVERARAEKTLTERAVKFADILNLSPEESTRQLAEDLDRVARVDPESNERLADATRQWYLTALNNVDAMRAPLHSIIQDKSQAVLADHAASLLGIGADGVAPTVFTAMGDAIRDHYGGENTGYRAMRSLDQWHRTIFGGGKTGFLDRFIASNVAHRGNAEMYGKLQAQRLRQSVKNAIAKSGTTGAADDFVPELLNYVHFRANELVDPNSSILDWHDFRSGPPKYGADGKIANPSLMRRAMDRLIQSKILENPALKQALDEEAARMVSYYRESLEAAQAAGVIKRPGIEGYTGPNTLGEEYQKAVETQNAAESAGRKKGFTEPRTTHHIAFTDPRDGKYHWFLTGDHDLLDEFPHIREGEQLLDKLTGLPRNTEEEMRKVYGSSPELLKTKMESREAARVFDELMSIKNPYPEVQDFQEAVRSGVIRPKITDPLDLSDLADKGYFDRMTGGDRRAKVFFETDPAMIAANHYATAQRVASSASMDKLIADQGMRVNKDALWTAWKSGQSREFDLGTGVSAKIDGRGASSFGTPVPTVSIGNEQYRVLDPIVRTRVENNLLDLHKINTDGLLVHHALADKIEDYYRTFNDDTLLKALGGLESVTGLWKIATLLHPSWFINDAIGHTVLSIMGGASPNFLLHPRRFSGVASLIKHGYHNPDAIKDLELEAGGVKYAGDVLFNAALDNRIIKNNLAVEMAGQALKQHPNMLSAAEVRIRHFFAPWFHANEKMMDSMRMMTFLDFLDQGHDVEGAAAATIKAAFDFGDFTSVERNIFRRLIPFYSWIRSNMGYQVRMLFERPMFAAAAPKVQHALEESINGEQTVPRELRPSWMRETLGAQIGTDPERRFALLLGNGALPVTDIYNIIQPLVGTQGALNFLHYFVGNANPALTVPLELGTGMDFFSKKTIGADIGSDMSPGEFLAGQIRPLAEYGPGGRVAQAYKVGGLASAASRALLGGRVQAFDQERLVSTKEREFRGREIMLRSAVRRAERLGDSNASLDARTQLLALYQKMDRLGVGEVPAWAREQLAQMAE